STQESTAPSQTGVSESTPEPVTASTMTESTLALAHPAPCPLVGSGIGTVTTTPTATSIGAPTNNTLELGTLIHPPRTSPTRQTWGRWRAPTEPMRAGGWGALRLGSPRRRTSPKHPPVRDPRHRPPAAL